MHTRLNSLLILFVQLLVLGLVALLLTGKVRYTFESASLIQVGMTPAEVEAVVGKPNLVPISVFTPIQVQRENGELKVDALGVTPSSSIYGPGLPMHILHSKQEEFPSYFGTLTTERYEFRLSEEVSIVVFYDKKDRVAKVFALPTTMQPGDMWVRLRWFVMQLLQ